MPCLAGDHKLDFIPGLVGPFLEMTLIPHSGKRQRWAYFNALSPNIHVQILVTDLRTFSCSISWEKLIKDQSNFPLVIILLILITFSLDCILVL